MSDESTKQDLIDEHAGNDFADLIDEDGYVDDRLSELLFPPLLSMAARLVDGLSPHAVGKTMLDALLVELEKKEYGSPERKAHNAIHDLHGELHDEEGTSVVELHAADGAPVVEVHDGTDVGLHRDVHRVHKGLHERHGELGG